MRFLITGARGQLAGEFLQKLQKEQNAGQDFLPSSFCSKLIALDRESLDISDSMATLEAVSLYKPDVVINCAAYNHVDRAEEDFDAAYRVNASGTKNLASTCKKHNALLVHYSTDYVFDGLKEDLYTEQDEPNPINSYGKSKLEGERLLLEETDNFLLFRVSWVFAEGKQNFFNKLKEWSGKKKVIKVVCNQISVPTYAEDIVRVTLLAINKKVRGVYHLTNSGYASRYEVARYYMERLGLKNVILPVGSDYFHTQAKRPYFSAMSNAKISKILKLRIPDWKDGLDRFLKKLISIN